MIISMIILLAKTELLPNYNTAMRALQTIQNDFTASTTETTKAVTREIAEVRKVATVILQETNKIKKAVRSTPSPTSSYASVLSNNLAAIIGPMTLSTQNHHSSKHNARSS